MSRILAAKVLIYFGNRPIDKLLDGDADIRDTALRELGHHPAGFLGFPDEILEEAEKEIKGIVE